MGWEIYKEEGKQKHRLVLPEWKLCPNSRDRTANISLNFDLMQINTLAAVVAARPTHAYDWPVDSTDPPFRLPYQSAHLSLDLI